MLVRGPCCANPNTKTFRRTVFALKSLPTIANGSPGWLKKRAGWLVLMTSRSDVIRK